MAEGLVGLLRLLGWLLVASVVVALGLVTAPALPVPPVLHPRQVPDWWSRSGPVAAAGSLLRLAVLPIAGGWSLFRAVVAASRALGRIGAVTAAYSTSGWMRIKSTGGLIRLALGLTSSGGVLGACTSSGHSAADGATVAAPVLVGPTVSAAPVSTNITRSSDTTIAAEPRRAGAAPDRAAAPDRVTASSRTRTGAPAARQAAAVRSRPAGPPGPHPVPPAPSTWTVRPGDDFWSIAEEVLTGRSPGAVSDGAVASYWSRLIAVNRGRLPQPGDPDLLFPGETLALPPL